MAWWLVPAFITALWAALVILVLGHDSAASDRAGPGVVFGGPFAVLISWLVYFIIF